MKASPDELDPLVPPEPLPVELSKDDVPEEDELAEEAAGTVEVVDVELVVVLVDVAAVKETDTVHPVSESVVSAAVSVTASTVVSVTSKMAFPLLSVDTDTGDAVSRITSFPFEAVWAIAAVDAGAAVMTAVPVEALKVTDFPVTGSPLSSLNSTVTVAKALPSAGTLPKLVTTVESFMVGKTGGGVPKVTDTNLDRARPSEVSVAV